jgi:hypothetical protein
MNAFCIVRDNIRERNPPNVESGRWSAAKDINTYGYIVFTVRAGPRPMIKASRQNG